MKEIILKRTKRNTQLPSDVVQSARVKLGSYYKNGAPGRGLTRMEVDKYLPDIVNMRTDDPGYRKAVNKYYANLSVEVTPGGTKLNMQLDESGFPVNLTDYIKGRFAMDHPKCGNTKVEALGNSAMLCYIEDPELEKEKIRKGATVTLDALAAYNRIKDDPELVKHLLIHLNVFVNNISPEDYIVEVNRLIEKDPKEFIAAAEDKLLKVKSSIKQGLRANILQDINGAVYMESEKLGNSIEDAAIFLSDKESLDTRKTFLNRLKEHNRVTLVK